MLVLDFDGVIVDSNIMKLESLSAAVSSYGEHAVSCIRALHIRNPSLTREEKLTQVLTKYHGSATEMADRLAACMQISREYIAAQGGVKSDNLALNALIRLSNRVDKLFILSGAPRTEVLEFMRSNRVQIVDTRIFGGPTSKMTNAQVIRDCLGIALTFLGDSLDDFRVAQMMGWNFFYISGWSLHRKEFAELGTRMKVLTYENLDDFERRYSV